MATPERIGGNKRPLGSESGSGAKTQEKALEKPAKHPD
jgi:hypothetical protein